MIVDLATDNIKVRMDLHSLLGVTYKGLLKAEKKNGKGIRREWQGKAACKI